MRNHLLRLAILALLFLLHGRAIAQWLSEQGTLFGRSARRWRWLWTGDAAAESAEGAEMAAGILRRCRQAPAHPSVSRIRDQLSTTCPGRAFHVYILSAPEVNAFAVPGGHIFLTAKLVTLFASDPDALAFVLAHEMSHVTCGHAVDQARLQVLQNWIASGLISSSLNGPTRETRSSRPMPRPCN